MQTYEENVSIEQDGHEVYLIRLHDLSQQLVLDEYQDPEHIQLQDIASGEVLKRFPYGNVWGGEGFSFDVSPRHNYLIIKEIVPGVSMDDLYATLYLLKPLPDNTPRNASRYGQLDVPMLTSNRYLTFMFSTDEHEQTIWLEGQEAGSLPVINVYEYGSSKPLSSHPGCEEVALYKVASYPRVELDHKIRDGLRTSGLNARSVVNDLTALTRQAYLEVCGYPLDYRFAQFVSAQLDALDNALLSSSVLRHTAICISETQPDRGSLEQFLQRLGLDAHYLSVQRGCHEFGYLLIDVPLSDSTAMAQSVALVSQACAERGINYEGYQISAEPLPGDWQAAVNVAFSAYTRLCRQVVDKTLSLERFIEEFYQLRKKHRLGEFEDWFDDDQARWLDDMALALSRFDDWDISEDALREKISRGVG